MESRSAAYQTPHQLLQKWPLGPQLGGGGEWEQVEVVVWFVAGGVSTGASHRGVFAFGFYFS